MADSGPFKIVGWMSDDFSSWLQADIQPPENDVRFTPKSGHSGARAGLPLLTPSGSSDQKQPVQFSVRLGAD